MRGLRLFIILLIVSISDLYGQSGGVKRPKLVVGLVVDQMRWDYLYRYMERYGNDGFRKLLNEGYSCENTMVNYLPSFTAPGHSCIYTGSVPSIHGMAANDWIDNTTDQHIYCVEDKQVHPAADGDPAGPSMSPRNLLATTITDELRLATNMQCRVYGVAIKDRSAILPAGHLGNGAYWYNDSTGNFCSSTYYANAKPGWLDGFNARKLPDSFLKQNWNLLYPANTYKQSLADDNQYEGAYKSESRPVFPHILTKGKYKAIKAIPAGNTLTFMLAKACMEGEHLGAGETTDFLCISLSATDYIGHQFAPNSIESEDTYLRLDREIADLLRYFDGKVEKGNYTLFLTADHGGAHNPQYLLDQKVPAGFLSGSLHGEINEFLKGKYGKEGIVSHFMNYQLTLNEMQISTLSVSRDVVKADIVRWLGRRPEIAYAIDQEQINNTALPEPIRTMCINGYNKQRSGQIQIILNPGWYESDGNVTTGTTHGTWNPYDIHIPLVWYGWHIPKGETNAPVNMTDIAPTLAALLHIQMPNGCIGKPIIAITDKK